MRRTVLAWTSCRESVELTTLHVFIHDGLRRSEIDVGLLLAQYCPHQIVVELPENLGIGHRSDVIDEAERDLVGALGVSGSNSVKETEESVRLSRN